MSSPSTSSFHLLYQILSSNRQKDKIDMILEPLQAMIQLALLSICPIGTKLRIQENILYLQIPAITQSISRWYNADKKDDLYFLYSVVKRYIKWYNPTTNKKSPLSVDLYQLITKMAKEGFDNLFKTYSSSDSNTVIHVIQMYKNLLEYNNDKILVDEYIVDVEKNKVNIDEVFERIIDIYDPHILQITQHTLLMMQEENDPSNQGHHLDGLNQMFMKYNKAIKEWIKVNLIL
jgi:hypothetical protein